MMPDMEKVIKCLTDIEQIMITRQEICPPEELQYWIELQEGVADAISLLKELKKKPQQIELEGGGSTWWYVCPECHGAIDSKDHFCRHCGQAVED